MTHSVKRNRLHSSAAYLYIGARARAQAHLVKLGFIHVKIPSESFSHLKSRTALLNSCIDATLVKLLALLMLTGKR